MVDEVLAVTKRANITAMGFVGNEAYVVKLIDAAGMVGVSSRKRRRSAVGRGRSGTALCRPPSVALPVRNAYVPRRLDWEDLLKCARVSSPSSSRSSSSPPAA